ncbi:hypothetical protein A45J_1820 [hot springs metagenome]|uniref:Uncharacterized protein n=1 Tax=hot springs metagenome TaxID=433727 RepID=A0A5J4L482_9ZZZZ
MKKWLVACLALAIVLTGYLAFSVIDSKTSVATAAKKHYSATIYVAGMGGHFAKADVMIDPNNTDNPIKINSLDRVVIGDKKTHPTHDPRIDNQDHNTLFWSTYVLDPNGKQHVGKTDLKTGNVIKDVAMDPDPRSPAKKPPVYCASAQSKNYYMPIFMGSEGYVDIFDKKTLEHKRRMYVSDIGFKAGTYQFVHGVSSNDNKKLLLAINELKDGKGTGKADFVIVDIPSLEKGEWKVIAKNSHTGEPGKTIPFRQYFSKDDKYIFQSAADRIWIMDANTLKLVDEKMVDGQVHDIMPTPDGKYAIMTIRQATEGCDVEGKPIHGKNITDGMVQLYDFEAKKIVGKQVSVCVGCHKGMGLGDRSAVLCGIDANYK